MIYDNLSYPSLSGKLAYIGGGSISAELCYHYSRLKPTWNRLKLTSIEYPITVRPARLEEAEFLTQESFRSKASWGYPDSWLKIWTDELTVTKEMISDWITFVVEVDGHVIACWARSPIQSEKTSPGLLFVAPEHQGKGYGRILAEAVKNEAKRKGLKFFTLEADANAAPFYEKVRGKQIGTQPSLLTPGRILPIIRFDL